MGTLYCEAEDIGRFAVNREVYEDLAETEQLDPPIRSASALMDGYLRARFTLPLVTWSDELRECCAVLAAYAIITTRGLKPGENIEDKPIYLRWKFWIEWLKALAAGNIVPDVTDSGSDPTPATSGIRAPSVSSNESRGYQGGGGAFSGRRS